MSDLDIGMKVFLQIAVILAVCRVFGYVGKRFFGQTQGVSEMIAGIFLNFPKTKGHEKNNICHIAFINPLV